jgi:hypothetical protein
MVRFSDAKSPFIVHAGEPHMRRNAHSFALIAAVVGVLTSLAANTANADPVTRIAKLSPRYASNVIEIHWETALLGGCTTSTFAVTNAGSANNDELAAFLLGAFFAGRSIEVVFGGGCDGGSNWIQTIRLVP